MQEGSGAVFRFGVDGTPASTAGGAIAREACPARSREKLRPTRGAARRGEARDAPEMRNLPVLRREPHQKVVAREFEFYR